MNSKSIMLALVTMLTISSIAQAYLVPGGQPDSGKPSNDPNRPGQYNPPPNQGGGGHGGGGYYPPPPPNQGGGGHGGGGYYPPPPQDHDHGHGGYYPPPPAPYYPPPPPNHGGGGYYPPPPAPYYPPPPPPPYYPPQPPPPPVYGQRIVTQVYVGRSVENEMLQLSYLAQLNTQYYGWEVTAVRASTRPNSPYRTVVSLVNSDRSVLATQLNPGYQIALYPNYTVIAGTQELFLSIEGSTFVDTIEVELLRR